MVFSCGLGYGCGGATTAFTSTGPTLPAQPDTCEFSIVTAAPTTPTTELGTIEIKYVKQTDWIYDESAFKRKVRTQVCRAGGDIVRAHINDNGLYMSATVLTTKAAPVPPPAAAPAPPEPEAVTEVAPPPPAAPPEKQAATKPEKKTEAAKDDEAAKATSAKKGNKKGASAKKDDDIKRDKSGNIDIDSLL